jgi:hypothetical protein
VVKEEEEREERLKAMRKRVEEWVEGAGSNEEEDVLEVIEQWKRIDEREARKVQEKIVRI